MKWTDEQVEKLKKLCFEGKSNTDIAATMHIKIVDVYAKRSQLGITIDKVKAAKKEDTSTKAAVEPIIPDRTVEKAFQNLKQALQEAMDSDVATIEELKILLSVNSIIINTELLLDIGMQNL